ncbi:2Fe-2S iron-sulfur cluster-binding protein, partial [Cyanobium sp. N5-Cardenillas]|uniref:2Fe-2S iron-sulfur cluster-binding protein n=1 Tax=Cyanobium sp. N5-Cardenillas TaxID=2823720 RepID=UPI0020CDD9D3
MSVVTLTVNGQNVAVPAGASLLEATRAAAADVPTLCHLDGLNPVSSCRLCLVEVEGSSKLLTACSTAAAEGMVVHTHTPRLREYRRMAVELFFAEGNHVCAVCVANTHCELQDMAVTVGMDHSRFPYQYPQRSVDASHPQFTLDHNRCILCTRSVRVCDEIEGAHVWDIGSRGG